MIIILYTLDVFAHNRIRETHSLNEQTEIKTPKAHLLTPN